MKDITEEIFEKSTILEIAMYFVNYKLVKDFCKTLKYEYQDPKIIIDSVNVVHNPNEVKKQLLIYFKLPHHSSKFKNLVVACKIIRNKYSEI